MAGTQKKILNDELAQFVRRYEAILRLIRQIDNGQFVSARQVEVLLGPKTKHKLALLKKQERKSPYKKPALICEYEVHLQRADTLHKAAQIFVNRGKLFKNYPKKLQAHRDEAARLYQVALDFLKNFFTVNQKDALKWFDRPVTFNRVIRPEFTEVPRVITTAEFKKNNGFAGAGLARPKSTRGNYIHLKRELLQREVDTIKPIYHGLEKALIDISSLVKPNFANPNLMQYKFKPSKNKKRIKIVDDSAASF